MKLSVCMITYNHERFLEQALESALMQQTNFDFEVVVGEDCSTDRTREILVRFAQRHPRVRALLHEKNLGINRNLAATLQACRGEYVALLEGDDFWTDRNKLQRQVDFLDKNRDYVLAFHDVEVLNDGVDRPKRTRAPVGRKRTLVLEDLVKIGNFIPTCTEVFRNRDFTTLPAWFFNLRFGDYPLNLMTAAYGKLYFMPEAMATFRRHAAGAFSGQSTTRHVEEMTRTLDFINEHFAFRYDRQIRATQSYWRAVESFRQGDVVNGRAQARAALRDRPLTKRGFVAALMYAVPAVYQLLRPPVKTDQATG